MDRTRESAEPDSGPMTGLFAELERRLDAGVRAVWPEGEFNELALAAFAGQFEAMPTFRGFCERRGRTPDTVKGWAEIPPVPTTAFKYVDLTTARPERVFRTSGTSRGSDVRGRHLIPRLSLYRAALLPPFEAHVLAGDGPLPFASLIPSPEAVPDSSLSYMVGAAADAFSSETHWLVDAQGAMDLDGLMYAIESASDEARPLLLLGTSLAWLHAMERLEDVRLEPLPSGSRVMDTGGFKGAARRTTKADLHRSLARRLGLPDERIVNEYGMTELLSQLYEPVLSEGPHGAGWHVAPPWLRARALDPNTLDELRPGEPGLLSFFDLANAGSVCHVLTEDLGSVVDGRVRLVGRASGAEPRGCSRAMDELLAAAGQ